jgi:hypothetical protein
VTSETFRLQLNGGKYGAHDLDRRRQRCCRECDGNRDILVYDRQPRLVSLWIRSVH